MANRYVKAVECAEVISKNYDIPLSDLVDVFVEIPTADVVEVVRCCDCIHKKENPDINNTCYLTCNKKWGLQGIVDPTDFCSYGERKED